MMIYKLSNRVKELREWHGLTQDELAEKLGVHKQTLSRYERGETAIPADIVIKITDLLAPNPYWFLTGKGPMVLEAPPGVIEEQTPYLLADEQEIIRFLREHPEIKGFLLRIIESRKVGEGAVEGIKGILDPIKT